MSTSNVLIATSTGRANSHLAMQDRKSELSSFWEILLIQLWVHFFTFPLLLSVSFRPGVKRTKKQQGRSDRIFFWWCTLCSCVCVSVFDLDEEVRGGALTDLIQTPESPVFYRNLHWVIALVIRVNRELRRFGGILRTRPLRGRGFAMRYACVNNIWLGEDFKTKYIFI